VPGAASDAALAVTEPWDVLHSAARSDQHYCTGNIGEAIPGVQTPLSWSVWGSTIEQAARKTFHRVGAFTRAEAAVPTDPGDRITQIFYGRGAFRLEGLAVLGDRLPGTTGAEVIAGMCGQAPGDVAYAPSRRRYAHVAAGLPRQMWRVGRRLPAAVTDTEGWYFSWLDRVGSHDLAETQALLTEASGRFAAAVEWQMTALSCAIQPLYDAIRRVTDRAGVGDPVALTSGYGGVPETVLVADLWAASRGRTPLAAVATKHGFHGPMEGELSARVWREDDGPLRALMAGYAACDDSRDPGLGDTARRAARLEMERTVTAAYPRATRPLIRQLFAIAGHIIPLRGAAKNSFLQAFDVLRAGARRAGTLLARRGVIDDASDVFFLTFDELTSPSVLVSREVVELRKARHAEYQLVRLPETWTGVPRPIPVGRPHTRSRPLVLTGTGVSSGTVEGRVRVVEDPTFTDVLPGEVLVAATTDPSWASVMFVSAALVVDIGGVMSHAAVVARDLGIPCVVNTGEGSRTLRTGDQVRVDGTAGTVEILRPHDELPTAQ
jgi:pyruvate,water dikinase